MVDHHLRGDDGIDTRGVPAKSGHPVAEGGEIHQRGNAVRVVQENP
jgi:hypothetical protein